MASAMGCCTRAPARARRTVLNGWRRARRPTFAALIAAALAVGVSACGGETEKKSGGGGLVIAAEAFPDGLDNDTQEQPVAQDIQGNVGASPLLYPTSDKDGLLLPQFDGKLKPNAYIKSYSVTNGGRTLQLKIKPGVKSHWGNELTSADFQWAQDRSWGLKAIGNFFQTTILGIKKPSWKVVDKYTWEITTPKPVALLDNVFATQDLAPIDSTEAKKHTTANDKWAAKWVTRNGPGWGPYKVDQWKPGDRVILVADPAWRAISPGTPKVDRITYLEVPQSADRLSLLQAGSVQIARALDLRQLQSLEKDQSVKVMRDDGNIVVRLQLTNNQSPFNKPGVRQALTYAVDYDGMLKSVYFGFAKQPTSPIPSTYPAHADIAPAPFDLAKAKQMLADAGYPNGFTDKLYYDASSPVQEQMAIQIAATFKRVGVTLSLIKVPASTFYQRIYQQKWSSFLLSDFPAVPDSGYGLSMWLHSKSFINTTRYSNPHVDQLLDEARSESDTGKRDSQLEDAQKLIVNDAPWVMLSEPGWQMAVRSNVSKLEWTPYNTVDYSATTQ